VILEIKNLKNLNPWQGLLDFGRFAKRSKFQWIFVEFATKN
jgi:hypothetical protein